MAEPVVIYRGETLTDVSLIAAALEKAGIETAVTAPTFEHRQFEDLPQVLITEEHVKEAVGILLELGVKLDSEFLTEDGKSAFE